MVKNKRNEHDDETRGNKDHDDNDHHDEHWINDGESHDSVDLAKNGVDDDNNNVPHHETVPSKKMNLH